MDNIEAKALALVNEVARERGSTHDSVLLDRAFIENEALCRAIERHEAFRQEVSDVVEQYVYATNVDDWVNLKSLIITDPDPLVAVLHEVDTGPEWDSPEDYCNKIRAALEARGLEIREKK